MRTDYHQRAVTVGSKKLLRSRSGFVNNLANILHDGTSSFLSWLFDMDPKEASGNLDGDDSPRYIVACRLPCDFTAAVRRSPPVKQ